MISSRTATARCPCLDRGVTPETEWTFLHCGSSLPVLIFLLGILKFGAVDVSMVWAGRRKLNQREKITYDGSLRINYEEWQRTSGDVWGFCFDSLNAIVMHYIRSESGPLWILEVCSYIEVQIQFMTVVRSSTYSALLMSMYFI